VGKNYRVIFPWYHQNRRVRQEDPWLSGVEHYRSNNIIKSSLPRDYGWYFLGFGICHKNNLIGEKGKVLRRHGLHAKNSSLEKQSIRQST